MTVLLEVLRRHWPTPRRQALLVEQRASLGVQTDKGWIQTLLVDPHGLGVDASHERLRTVEPSAPWVWVLDDDDRATNPTLVADLRADAAARPEVSVWLSQFQHGNLGILPQAPICRVGRIGASAVIVRKDVWMATRGAWGARYEGDFDWLETLFAHPLTTLAWQPKVLGEAQTISYGRP